MDWVFIFIILITIIILFLDCWHRKPIEKFTSKISGENDGFKGLTNLDFTYHPLKNSGIFGSTPPIPNCNITKLGGNCTNYPYSTALDKYLPVCQKSENLYPYGNDNFKTPLFVMSKQTGRTRQCKNLYNPLEQNNSFKKILKKK